jgi:gliding motility-associated lipoprotein GldH
MTRKRNKIVQFLILPLLMMITACSRNTLFTDSVIMPGKTWGLSYVPEFTFPVDDTINPTNVVFNIRTGSDYPFRNIYLFVTAISPDGKTITDTLHYNLADEKGKWYGKGFGDIHDLSLPYRSNVFFPLKGTYKFKIRHGMRIGDLKGVYDFGLRIEESIR